MNLEIIKIIGVDGKDAGVLLVINGKMQGWCHDIKEAVGRARAMHGILQPPKGEPTQTAILVFALERFRVIELRSGLNVKCIVIPPDQEPLAISFTRAEAIAFVVRAVRSRPDKNDARAPKYGGHDD